MGFKFGKCKQLTTLKEQSLATTAPDFIDFEGCDELTTLSGEEVTNRHGALNNTKAVTVSFKNCAKLTTIGSHMLHMASGVASNLESIDFTGCIGLKTIGSYFLSQSTNIHSDKITKIDLSPCVNLTSIGMCFCPSCAELVELDMHGLTKLTTFSGDNNDSEADDKARGASRCPKLAKVDMSGCLSLEYIGSFAFAYCQALSDVNLTGCSSLKYLRMGCFSGASDAENTIETIIGWEEVKHQIEFIGTRAFGDNEHLNIDISHMENLKTIAHGYTSDKPYGAFTRCTSLRSCPNNCPSLVTIGMYAFTNCTNLGLNDDGTHATLDLSNNTNLTTIGDSAFEGVKAIETINLDNDTSLASLGNKCFYNNTELKHFYARNCTSLTRIGDDMLRGSTKLLDARFGGSGVQTYGMRVFKNLSNLLYVEFPEDTVKTIGYECMHTSGLQTIKSSLNNYDEWKAAITQAQINAGLISAGDDYLSTHLKSNVLQKIDGFGFFKCSIIEYVNGDNSPYNCNHGEKEEFEQSVIHELSFQNCTTLTRFSPQYASAAKILETLNCTNSPVVRFCDSSFRECSQLQNVECDKTIINQLDAYAFYMTTRADATAYDWACQPLVAIGNGAFHRSALIKSITTDGGTATSVGAGFASFAPNLETVSITNMATMTTIGDEAFIQCPKLQSCDFSGCNALTTIGSKAFQIDSMMTTFKIQDSPLADIKDYAFMSCLRLENFDADSSQIKTIGQQAFEYCTSFKTFKIHQDDTQPVTYSRAAFAGWRNAGSGLIPPTYPLDIYIYGSTPGDVPGDETWNFVNGMNNNGCQVTIHFTAGAENDYKTIAKNKEDVAHARTTTDVQTGKDVVWYWCCSNGQATATTGGTTPVEGNFQCAGWYATSIATTPTVVFDL